MLTYIPFCLHNYEILILTPIYQVDNRPAWLESVTLQLGPIHPMLSSYVINNIKSYVGLLYLELNRDRSQSQPYVEKVSFSWIKGGQQSMLHAFTV